MKKKTGTFQKESHILQALFTPDKIRESRTWKRLSCCVVAVSRFGEIDHVTLRGSRKSSRHDGFMCVVAL